MKKPILAFVSGMVLAFIAETVTAQTVNLNNSQFDYVNGKWYRIYDGTATPVNHHVITVKFKVGVTNTQINQLNDTQRTTILRKDILGYHDLELAPGVDPIAMVQAYQSNSLVEYAQPNTFAELFGDPNDPNFANQWHHNHPQDRDIDTPKTWDITTGNPNIILAILDTGTDIEHEDLAGNIWVNQDEASGTTGVDDDNNGFVDDIYGWNFCEGHNVVEPPSSQGRYPHGTHVAGVAGGLTNNGQGISGVAGGWDTSKPGGQLMTLVVADQLQVDMSLVDNAILYAAQKGYELGKKVVINMSFGQPAPDSLVQNAINTAYGSYGAFVVAASGNYLQGQNTAVAFPANAANVFAVGASDKSDTRQTLLDPHPCVALAWGSAYGNPLDVVAPGIHIWSTQLDDQYGCDDGTSFAASQVSGLSALLWTVAPDLTNDDLEEIIASTAEKVGGYSYSFTTEFGSWNNQMGYGRINAYKALKYTLENYGGTLSGEVVFTEDITIKSGATLTIDAGTTVKFAPGTNLTVKGTLNVDGTSSNPVTFTSSGSSWNGLYFSQGSGTLKYCNLDNLTGGWASSAITINSSSPVFENCTIDVLSGGYVFGVSTSGSSSQYIPKFYRCTVQSASGPAMRSSDGYLYLHDTEVIQTSSEPAVRASGGAEIEFWLPMPISTVRTRLKAGGYSRTGIRLLMQVMAAPT